MPIRSSFIAALVLTAAPYLPNLPSAMAQRPVTYETVCKDFRAMKVLGAVQQGIIRTLAKEKRDDVDEEQFEAAASEGRAIAILRRDMVQTAITQQIAIVKLAQTVTDARKRQEELLPEIKSGTDNVRMISQSRQWDDFIKMERIATFNKEKTAAEVTKRLLSDPECDIDGISVSPLPLQRPQTKQLYYPADFLGEKTPARIPNLS